MWHVHALLPPSAPREVAQRAALSSVRGVLPLLLVAASVGVANFAVAIGIGVAGVDAGTRLRVGLIFGLFEAGMPVLGVLLGQSLAPALGGVARWIGAALLIAAGGYAVLDAVRGQAREQSRDQPEPAAEADRPGTGRLLVTGIALSIDNLAVASPWAPITST